MDFKYPNTLFDEFDMENWNIQVGPFDPHIYDVPSQCQTSKPITNLARFFKEMINYE
jgi:hypothetical protein